MSATSFYRNVHKSLLMCRYATSDYNIYIYIYIYIYTLAAPGHALLWLSLFKWKKKKKMCVSNMFNFQYLDNKYIKTLLNSNKILSENFNPIGG